MKIPSRHCDAMPLVNEVSFRVEHWIPSVRSFFDMTRIK